MLAAGSLLLLQFTDGMSAMTPVQQNMQCCGSMQCAPQQPATRVSLHVPRIETIEDTGIAEIVRSSPLPLVTLEVQLHSPPELYTLHASLLI
jgi:hypothetical protein